jgi:maltose alpha-D-glucosyltransferase/alpha-amylase
VYGYTAVNVEAQSRSTASLLNWTRRLVAARKAHLAFSRGSTRFLRPGNRKVMAYIREHDGDTLLCVANLARSSQPVELELAQFKGRVPLELLGSTPFPPIGDLPYLLTLPPWGFYWFSLRSDAEIPKWHVERPVNLELPALVIPEGLTGLLARGVRDQIEQQVLPQVLPQQRWFADAGRSIERVALLPQDEWQTASGNWLLAMVRVESAEGGHQTYSLPLALAWEQGDGASIDALLHCTFARVRQRARAGVLYDAFWDDAFCREAVAAMQGNLVRKVASGELRWRSTTRLGSVDAATLDAKHSPLERTNTLVVLGERLVLKGYRRLHRGINPEVEMGRFLTDVSPFANAAALCGSLEHVDDEGATPVAVLHAYVSNEGSGWDYTIAHLRRLVEDALAQHPAEPADATVLHGGFRSLMQTLGRRTAELHRALAVPSGDPAFAPVPFAPGDVAALRASLVRDVDVTLEILASREAALPDPVRAEAARLLAMRDTVRGHASAIVPDAIDAVMTRCHGDYDLRRVLISKHDFVIVDFEGDPSLPLARRRAKHSPLRDVASMLRSFGYAAAAAQNGAVRMPEHHERAADRLAEWQRETSEAFVAGYREAIGDAPSFPRSEETARRLLAAFTLEKALLELRGELANRQDWVAIPLRAVLELVERA